MHNDEHKEEKLPLFSRLNDAIDNSFQRTGKFIANIAEDQPGIFDDIVRGGLQGLSFVGNLPVIKQIGQLEDKLVDTVGDLAENQNVVDPRSFRYATRVGTMFIPYAGAAKVLSKGKKASKAAKAVNVVDDAALDAQRLQSGLKMRLLKSIDPNDASNTRFVPPTPKQIYDTKQELMKNQLTDGSGKLNIWNYFNNKKGRSDWGRLMAKKIQTLPHTKEAWASIKKELQTDFLSIYPESFLKTIKIKNAKGNWVPLSKKNIEVEHIFTLQQSMPIFADVDWGGQAWQDIAKQILSRQFATGDTRQNLIAVPEHIHRIKTQYFNKIAGISGRKFFTDEVIKNMIANPDYRKAKINEWLDEVTKGKKIIDDGLTIWETLYKGKGGIPAMPEALVERLSKIDLDNADIQKVLPQIFEEFKKEGFTTDAWNVKELKAQQLVKDRKAVEAAEIIIDKEIKSNPKKYNNPYPFGMRDNDLRERAEAAWNEIRKNRLLREDIQDDLFETPKQKERFIKYTMKSILNQQNRK